MEKGSGCVKITPAHDFNDYEVGKRQNHLLINVFTKDATILEQAEIFDLKGQPQPDEDATLPAKYAGLDRFEARKQIVADMEALGLLVQVESVNNTLPYGDRSGDVIEPLLTDQWFVAVESLAKPAIEAVENGDIQSCRKTTRTCTSPGCATCRTGVFLASCGGATAFRLGTTPTAMFTWLAVKRKPARSMVLMRTSP